jgi:hypothetical protein
MNRNSQRMLNALLVAICLMVIMISPTYAQRSEALPVAPARIQAADGRTVLGPHVVMDDLVIVCPFLPLAQENHPCNNNSAAPINVEPMDDYALVCPIKEVLDQRDPCHGRRTMGMHGAADDFTLVCPVKEVLEPSHPCAQRSSAAIRFVIPNDYALTCPIEKVLDPYHPCFNQ